MHTDFVHLFCYHAVASFGKQLYLADLVGTLNWNFDLRWPASPSVTNTVGMPNYLAPSQSRLTLGCGLGPTPRLASRPRCWKPV